MSALHDPCDHLNGPSRLWTSSLHLNWDNERSVLHERTKSLKLLASLCQFQIDRKIVLVVVLVLECAGASSEWLWADGDRVGYFEPIINKLAFMMDGGHEMGSKATLSFRLQAPPPLEGSFSVPP